MITTTCANCGVAFGLPAHLERRRRDDHDTFWCPNGHKNYYPGKTDEEKRIEQLERSWKDTSQRLVMRTDQMWEWKRECRVCPICEESVTRAQYPETIRAKVAEHLRDEHGAKPRLRAIPQTTGVAK